MKKLYLCIAFAVAILFHGVASAQIVLQDTNDTLEVVTGSAVTTIHIHATWADVTTTTFTEGSTNSLVTTAVTTTAVAAPGASTRRHVKLLTVYNSHASSSNDISVQMFDGTNRAVLMKYTLLAGESLQYDDNQGFKVVDASGQVKSAVAADTELPAAAALADNAANPTTTGVGAYMMCWDSAGSNWDRCQAGLTDTDDGTLSGAQVPTLTLNIPYVWNGTNWVRQTGDATNGLDVDVTRVPTDPFGANADAASATGSISAKLRHLAATGIAGMTSLPAGTNNIGDVDVLSLPALPAGTNNIGDVDIVTINGQAPAFGSGARSAATQRVTIATDDVVPASQSGTWTVQPGNTANTTPWLTSQTPVTSGGLSISRLLSAATTNSTNAKASAGQVYGWYITNTNAAVRYVKLYNLSTAPTCGTSTPVITLAVPGATTGGGTNVSFGPGIAFGTGIGYCATTGAADNDTGAVAANEIIINLFYK